MELLGWYLQCVCLGAGAVLPVPPVPPLQIKLLHGNRARNKYFPHCCPTSELQLRCCVWWGNGDTEAGMHPLSQEKVNISPDEKW